MTGWRIFPLRILHGARGIAIGLRARAVSSTRAPPGLLSAGERVLLDVRGVRLAAADAGQLQAGLRLVAAAIGALVAHGYVIIEVGEVTCTPADYQAEGVAAAMAGWACEEFGLESPVKDARFDKSTNRYVFSF